MTNATNQTKRIEAYSICDFAVQLQKAIIEGYRLNVEDNEKYPLQIGVGFYATLDKVEEDATAYPDKEGSEIITSTESKTNAVSSTKPGRKPKG